MNLLNSLKEIGQVVSSDGSGAGLDVIDDQEIIAGCDESYMARALNLARKGLYTTHPNPAVGCVIVKDEKIIGQGWHKFAGQDHAEVIALRQAGKFAQESTLYVTLEPCSHQGKTPPCVKAIIKAGVRRVVIAMEDPNPLVNRSGISELQRAEIDVVLGVGQDAARRINRGFLKRITTGQPWVTLKIATSLDGKIAMADGESQWITDQPARTDGQKLRAESAAILTGVGTVLRDDPGMNARMEGVQRQPARIILDTNLSTPRDARILSNPGDVLIITSNNEENLQEYFSQKNVEVHQAATTAGRIDLQQMMLELGRRQLNSILLEAGPQLSGSMLAQGLVDEIVVYMSPDLLGADAKDMFNLPAINELSDKLKFKYRDVTMIGRDIRLTLTPY